MRRISEFSVLLAVVGCGWFGAFLSQGRAAEVLVNGNLESSVSPVGWSLSTSITGQPGSTIPNVVEHNDGGNQPAVIPGELGLQIHPQVGNQGDYSGQNLMTNLTLEQIANGIAGRAYTFTGYVYFGGDANAATDEGYSGGVTNLDPMSPSGPIASPTQTTFEVTFLNASLSPIGSPSVLDLRTVQPNDAIWHQQSLVTPAAPAGTTKVRVRAIATNMVDNFGFQTVQLDNFSLRDSVSSAVERLTNAGLNTPGDPAGFTQVEGPVTPQGTPDSLAFINFANHTSGGKQGVWLRPYVNTTQFTPDIPTDDAQLQQVVTAHPGAQYSFSAWTAWEQGFCGGNDPSVLMLLKMEFLDGSSNPIGTALTLNLRDAGMTNDLDGGNIEADDWRQFTLNGTAPGTAASVRVTIAGLNMYDSANSPQSAFFDDLSLIETTAGVPGDYNGNGTVDAGDYVLWRKGGPLQNDPTPGVQAADYTFWRSHFGAPPGSGSGVGAAAVPEPAALFLVLISLAGGFGLCRHRL